MSELRDSAFPLAGYKIQTPTPMSNANAFARMEARSAQLQNSMDVIAATLEHNRVIFKQKIAGEFDRVQETMGRGMEDVQKEVVAAIRAEAQK